MHINVTGDLLNIFHMLGGGGGGSLYPLVSTVHHCLEGEFFAGQTDILLLLFSGIKLALKYSFYSFWFFIQ